jgi:hypothetical protein
MLKRIVIENYRSCLRTSLDFHPELSVLIGPNSSGKTNILQAIMLLSKLAQAEPYRVGEYHAARGSPSVKTEFRASGVSVRLDARVDVLTGESNNDVIQNSRQKWVLTRKGGPQISAEFPLWLAAQFTSGGMPSMYHLRAHGLHFPARFLKRQGAFWPGNIFGKQPKWAIRTFVNIATYCAGIRYYGASQFTNPRSCPVSFEIEQDETPRRLFRQGGHARLLYDLYIASKSEVNHRYRQFLDLVGPRGLKLIDGLRFTEVPTSSVDYSVRVGGKVEGRKKRKLLVIPQFSLGRQRLSPNQLSEGTFKTLALLFHIITEDGTALLIEEPEVCVHHGLLSSILELVKSHSRYKQIILSTHSDYVLDQVTPENVFRVTFNRSSGTSVRQIQKTMTSKEYSALRKYLDQEGNLGEYWREGGLGEQP